MVAGGPWAGIASPMIVVFLFVRMNGSVKPRFLGPGASMERPQPSLMAGGSIE